MDKLNIGDIIDMYIEYRDREATDILIKEYLKFSDSKIHSDKAYFKLVRTVLILISLENSKEVSKIKECVDGYNRSLTYMTKSGLTVRKNRTQNSEILLSKFISKTKR